MTPWTFRQYVTDWGEWPFRDWYQRQDPHVRNGFDFMVRDLRLRDDWLDPPSKDFQLLSGEHAPLAEIRYRADDLDTRSGKTLKKRRIRPVGLYRPGERDFILFGGAEEVPNGKYIPENGFDRAKRLWAEFEQGKGALYDLD